MFTEDSLQKMQDMIKTMLDVSPYFDWDTVVVKENEETYTVFTLGEKWWIEVRYNNFGLHVYLPGYDKQVGGFGDEPPSIEEVYIGHCNSLHQSVVKIVTRIFEHQLQVFMEGYEHKSYPINTIFDEAAT
jgi:hypothetical protein